MSYDEMLKVKIYATNIQCYVLEAWTSGENVEDFDSSGELCITNFHKLRTPMQCTVSMDSETFQVGTVTFETVNP